MQIMKIEKALKYLSLFLMGFISLNPASAQLFSSIPRQFSMESYMPPVKHQHDRNTCASFATLAALECEINIKFGLRVNFSEQYMHNLAVDSTSGLSTMARCGTVLTRAGALLEQDWPYQFSYFSPGLPCEGLSYGQDSTPGYCFGQLPPPSHIAARKVKFKLDMSSVRGTRKICQSLSANHPVIMWIPMEYQKNSDKSGILWVDTNQFQMHEKIDGHFVVAYGYDLEKDLFYIQNSYGNTWGNQGRGTMPFRYFRKIEHTYSTYFVLDSIWGLPEIIPPQQPDSVWLYRAETKAFFQDDSALCIQIRGYQSPQTLNAFNVHSEVVERKKSDTSGTFELLRLNGSDSMQLQTTIIQAMRNSISGPMGIEKGTFSTTEPFTLTIPKALACSSTLTMALQDATREVSVRTRIVWQTDTYGLSLYQEYLTPIQVNIR
jgi:hypothetical protein